MFALAVERLRIEWTAADDDVSWQLVTILGVSMALAVVGFMQLDRRESNWLGGIGVALLAVPYALDATGAAWRLAYVGDWLILLINLGALVVAAVVVLFAIYFFLVLVGVIADR